MPNYYLIDTNVMLAASAYADALSDLLIRAMPKEEEYRELVYIWLRDFQDSPNGIILDESGCIEHEYNRNMPFNRAMKNQEYGLQVLQTKWDNCLVEYVPIDVIDANGERIAILPEIFAALVTDREDRKWVASAISAKLMDIDAPIVYGAESDWFHIQNDLTALDILFHRLLPNEWYLR